MNKKFFSVGNMDFVKEKTANAIMNLIDNIESDIDNKQFVCGAFIEFQKAFDTVDYILLEEIQHYGIIGIAHQWFKSYLENIKQFVPVSGAESELGSVNYGEVILKAEVILFNPKSKQLYTDLRLKLCI